MRYWSSVQWQEQDVSGGPCTLNVGHRFMWEPLCDGNVVTCILLVALIHLERMRGEFHADGLACIAPVSDRLDTVVVDTHAHSIGLM
jgi:hypothetical protein